jgi:ABC-type dipeptide/oligopeptide/nickel transport system permease subunit
LITAGGLPLQLALTDPRAALGASAAMMLMGIGIPLGVLAGYLGGRFTTMMNALAPATKAA